MALVTLKEILPAARREGRAVGAFNVANFETALAATMAAEAEEQPVILQVYHRLMEHPRIGSLAAMLRKLAEESPVPVAVHLDHGVSLAQLERALRMGFSSVMIDGSSLPLAENIRLTSSAVRRAAEAGASVEAEIGSVPLNRRDLSPLPTPAEVADLAGATGVDALAVAVGTVHGYYRDVPAIDLELARRAGEATPIPLVLHGGSGTPQSTIGALIGSGFAKVNIATEFQHRFLRRLLAELSAAGDTFVPLDKLMQPVVEATATLLRTYIRLFSRPQTEAPRVAPPAGE